MVNQEVLQDYCNSITRLKKQCLDEGLTEKEFQELYFESLHSIEMEVQPVRRRRWFSRIYKLLFFIISLICVTYYFKTIYSCLVCNVQEYIYPGLRLLRRLSVPFISLFPKLTEFYHETCLIQNPFFTVVDMDCWPCSTVTNIREVQNANPVTQQHTAPFIYQTDQRPMKVDELKNLYEKHKNVFDKEHSEILTNNKYYVAPQDMFKAEQNNRKNMYIWKFNTMNVARILRQAIPRPKVVPKFGQSTERFIIVDSSQDSFKLPDTECSFSFLLLLSGDRTVHLVPAQECKHQCKTLKVDLKETYLLWYNWWYWRPVVQSSNGNITVVAHVGSYC